jgi:phospholipid transport system transporter-binding protein
LSAQPATVAEVGPGQFEFEDRGNGQFAVYGDLTFRTAALVLDESKALFADHSSIDLDLAGVKRADSAGLALMLEWVNWARNNVREIRFHNIPAQVISIAQISEVEEMLYKAERWTGA